MQLTLNSQDGIRIVEWPEAPPELRVPITTSRPVDWSRLEGPLNTEPLYEVRVFRKLPQRAFDYGIVMYEQVLT